MIILVSHVSSMQVVRKFLVMASLVSLTHALTLPSPTTSSRLPRVTHDDQPINYRLSRNIIPISYKIMLNPDLDGEQFSFYGESEININVGEATDVITLHAKNLEIRSGITVKCDLTNDVEVSTVEPSNTITDFLNINLGKQLQAGSNCNLSLTYIGQNSEGHLGFYRYSHKTAAGEQKWLASNSFHPMGARLVFPCWDEPAFKANFTIIIEHSKNYVALSNMDVEKQEINPKNPERLITHFAQSPKMSTYLVAFTICNYVKVDSDNQEFRVWVPNHLKEYGKYASKMGPEIMNALETYTNYSYQAHGFRKMDSIVMELPIIYTAIEDWGLVKYQERGLLLNEETSPTSRKEYVIKTMAHELAHQWFGNLVTAEWYDNIWLNEGFANYFQYAILDQIEPIWRMKDRYVLEIIQSNAFVIDSKKNIHAMETKRDSSDDVRHAYDSITYKKSGAIIRMMSHVLGEEKFKSGVRNYLRKKAFAAATSEDLFQEFSKLDSNNTNLLAILKNWVTVPGYPLLTVTRDYQSSKAIITQSRFLNKVNPPSNEKYWIPINFVTTCDINFTDTSVTHWFDPSKNSIVIDELESDQFVIFNKQLFGYYRVNYDMRNWALITDYLKTAEYTNIHVLNRAQLIDDAMNLAKVGHLKYNVVLSLIGYLDRETEFIPWSVAWKVIGYIRTLLANTEFDDRFTKYVLKLSKKLVNEVLSVKLDDIGYITNLKRPDALKWACLFGSNSCQTEARNKLIKWLDNPEINALSPDDRDWIICAGVRNADRTTWNRLWGKYLETSDRNMLLQLGCSLDIAILKTFLSNSIATNPIYMSLSVLFAIVYEKSAKGSTAVLEYMIEHYNEVIALNGYSIDELQNQLITLSEKLIHKAQHEQLKQFIKNNEVPMDSDAVEALEVAENRLNVVENNRLDEFRKFFLENQ